MNVLHNNPRAFNHAKFFGFIFVICLFIVVPAVGQEHSGFGNDDNSKPQDELSPNLDNHVNNPTSSTKEKETLRDSLSILKPVPAVRSKPDAAAPKKEEEDETLSFNFLYFIIQKFKVSDMMN